MLHTRNFGDIEVPQDKIIHIRDGIPGLECMRRCFLVKVEDTLPIYWLQSVEDGAVALPVVNPLVVDSAYAPRVEDSLWSELALEREADLLIVNVAVIPQDIKRMTANMAAPILINIERNIGRQVVLDDGAYSMRLPIYEAVCQYRKGEAEDAGADQKAE